jgi:putative transposase
MSGDRYYISDQHAPYFLTWTIIHWIDIFTRQNYRDIVVDSLNFCVKEKNLIIHAWVIMSNHVHLVARSRSPNEMSAFLRDSKKFTSKAFVKEIQHAPESRREWLLDKFEFEAKRSGRAEKYKTWKDSNHPVDLSHLDMMEKIDYIHENPVRAGIVEYPEHYLYSSARDYTGKKGLVDVVVI